MKNITNRSPSLIKNQNTKPWQNPQNSRHRNCDDFGWTSIHHVFLVRGRELFGPLLFLLEKLWLEAFVSGSISWIGVCCLSFLMWEWWEVAKSVISRSQSGWGHNVRIGTLEMSLVEAYSRFKLICFIDKYREQCWKELRWSNTAYFWYCCLYATKKEGDVCVCDSDSPSHSWDTQSSGVWRSSRGGAGYFGNHRGGSAYFCRHPSPPPPITARLPLTLSPASRRLTAPLVNLHNLN